MTTMRSLAISFMLLVTLPCWPQTTTWGNNSGTGQFTVNLSGVVSPFSAYTGTDPIQWPNPIPNVGGLTKNNVVFHDTSYPYSPAPPGARCTDANTAIDQPNKGYTISFGSAGNGREINANDTFAAFNLAGAGPKYIIPINLSAQTCGTTITRDKNLDHPGSSGLSMNFGTGEWDQTNPAKYYNFGDNTDNTVNTVITLFTIAADTTFHETVITDFYYGLPLGARVPGWLPSHAYGYGAYVSHALTASEYFAWAPSSSSFQIGDLMVPSLNNPANCAFKLSTAGTTGTSQPSWGSTCSIHTVTDGTAVWRSIGGPAVFTYQLVAPSIGGTSGGGTPTFVATKGHPDLGLKVTDGPLTWMNVGGNIDSTSIQWTASAGNSFDGTRFTEAVSTNGYGMAGFYNNDNADQGTGVYTVSYETSSNRFRLHNTMTGIDSEVGCTGGTGYTCSGGTQAITTLGLATDTSTCGFVIHNAKGSWDESYVLISPQGNVRLGVACPTNTNPLPVVWRPWQSPYVAATQAQWLLSNQNHSAMGKTHLVNLGQSGYGYTTGVYYGIADLTNPHAPYSVIQQAKPCSTTLTGGVYNPPRCNPALIDGHPGWQSDPQGTDTAPAGGVSFNVTDLNPFEQNAWQGEVVMFTTSPSWTDTNNPNSFAREWRISHTFATGTHFMFDAQFALSAVCQTMNCIFWTSDWNSQLGSLSGAVPTLPISIPGVTCLGGKPWQANQAYALGVQDSMIHPIAGTSGSGAVYHVFEAIVAGTTGVTQPTAFTTSVLGQHVIDGTVTWQDLGPQDNTFGCRPDVFFAKLR